MMLKYKVRIKKALGLPDDESLKKVIEDALIEGKKDPNDPWAYIKYYDIQKNNELHVYQLRVIISDRPDRAGWIANARVIRMR